ncbi:mucin-3A-like isoform X2 [Rhineura floridana]|uniref:mucin-3A-like isoform X2 n=1 Tax=Rhineura floridana TaxID=261503 RepID=UPI002AC7EEEC|nr:mucin-3A-like isoform X2 [Rhineura floridana]
MAPATSTHFPTTSATSHWTTASTTATTIKATTQEKCENGGTHDGIKCLCLSLFYGPKCEFPVEIPSELEKCENGGTHDGIKCLCLSLFYGPKCEFPVEELEPVLETVPVTVEVQVRITSKKYKEELQNKSSEEYKTLEKTFTDEMNSVYENVAGYRGVVILNLRNGSIIVDHEVIIEAMINNNVNNIEAVVQNLTETVREQLVIMNSTMNNCTNSSTICFSAPTNPILNTTTHFSAEEFCRKIIHPKYVAYYYPDTTTGTLRCISNCTKDTLSSINCNHGVCRISERGPQCNCDDIETFWYVDNHCQTRFQKGYVGFGLALAVLLVASAILAIFLIRAKRRKSGASWSDDAELWYGEDEEEWHPSKGLSFKNEGTASRDSKDTLHHKQGSQDRSKTFQLSLDSVDTSLQLQFQKPTTVDPSPETILKTSS